MTAPASADEDSGRSALTPIALSQLFGLSLWFSASAVAPQLRQVWDLSTGQEAGADPGRSDRLRGGCTPLLGPHSRRHDPQSSLLRDELDRGSGHQPGPAGHDCRYRGGDAQAALHDRGVPRRDLPGRPEGDEWMVHVGKGHGSGRPGWRAHRRLGLATADAGKWGSTGRALW